MYEVNKCQTKNNNWIFNLSGNYYFVRNHLSVYFWQFFFFFVDTLPALLFPCQFKYSFVTQFDFQNSFDFPGYYTVDVISLCLLPQSAG